MNEDTTKGLYVKYSVKRITDLEGKHNDCEFFVLDLNHDKFAIPALKAYAEACKEEYPLLAEDLVAKLNNMEGK